MFDLPIPQQQPEKPVQFGPPPESGFKAEAVEYESGMAAKSFYKKFDWVLIPSAIAGTVFGYFAHSAEFGNLAFTASLLASAVFLYVFRR